MFLMQVISGPNFKKHRPVQFDVFDHRVSQVRLVHVYSSKLSLVPSLSKHRFSKEHLSLGLCTEWTARQTEL